jgi:dUTP pyrophosphatase
MSDRNDTIRLSDFQVSGSAASGTLFSVTPQKLRVTSGIEVDDPDAFEFDFPICHVKVKRKNKDIPLPKYSKDGDAGFDLAAAESGVIEPKETKLVGTGLYVAVPKGFYLAVVPRSGISLKTSFWVRNSPGTVDPGFRGEVCIVAHNSGDEPHEYASGDRLAQGIILPVYRANFIEVEELDETERGEGGYGSTGVASV